MKCPNCGAWMKDGHMYCERCGREIQIVPEFEPELENSIHTTLSNVATEITAPSGDRKRPSGEKGPWKKFHKPGKNEWKAFRILLFVLLGLACLGGIVAGVRRFWPDYQYQQARQRMEKEDYRGALAYYQRAVSLSPNSLSCLNGLSACYYMLGEYDAAEEICLEMLALEGSNEAAYQRLVSIYGQQQEYGKINELMQECKSQDIISMYLDYMANPPQTEPAGGTYHEVQNVKLISNAAGTIYYTTDGSAPDESSPVYTGPIVLESGDHTVKAFFVNEYGVRSDVVTARFSIDASVPDPPEVTPASGTYEKPVQIAVEVPEGCKVYYTTDRTDPGTTSRQYEAPFWMPAGYSTFRFAVVSPNGVTGEVTERQYALDLHAVLSMEAASNQLLLTLKNAGVILNIQGDLPDRKGHNLYTYRYALTINDNNYYLYREYYEEKAGTSNATGNDYVVNYMSGECYRAIQQEDGTWKLYNIQEDEAESSSGEGF